MTNFRERVVSGKVDTIRKHEPQPFSEPVLVTEGNAILVNSDFILQLHWTQNDIEKGLRDRRSPRLGIFALARTRIEKVGQEQRVPMKLNLPWDAVTFLHLSASGEIGDNEVIIGNTEIRVIRRDNDFFNLVLRAARPIVVRDLKHDLDTRNREEARRHLTTKS